MQLKALGGLRLSGAAFQKSKPLLLLCYLLVEGKTERRHLAELFWPGAANHMNSLAKAMSQLRKAVPEALETDEAKVWAILDSDVGELLGALASGDDARAVGLYNAPFLEDVFLHKWGSELEEWVYMTREHLAGRVRGAHLRLAEEVAGKGRTDEALRHAENAFTLKAAPPVEPGELERLYRLFLLGSSAHLSRLRSEAESYGVTLGESRKEAERYFQPETPSDSVSALQRRGTAFIGRELELAELEALLHQETCRLLTIVGQGGAGKTRLALELAQVQSGRAVFEDGVFVVELEALMDPATVPIKIADVLALSLRGPNEPAVQVQRQLGPKQLLLVLDNCEQLSDMTYVSALLGACPNLKILATSRERLYLEEEWLFSLAGLAYPERSENFFQARDYDALQLFSERARRAHRNFKLDTAALPHAVEICALVQGSPLALELAAGWVKTLALAEVAHELRAGLDILQARNRNIPDRHQSIRAAFDGSWAYLSVEERESLKKIAVFKGGFTRQAALDVTDTSVAVLAALIDKSLVQAPTEGRYSLHPLLHQYALEKLEQDIERTSLYERHRTYYLNALQSWRDSEVYPSPATIHALTPELENILRAWRRTFQEGGDIISAAEALTWYFEVRAQYFEGLELLNEAQHFLELQVSADEKALGYLLVYKAWLGHWLESERADRWAKESLTRLRPLDAVDGVILALRTLGIIAWQQGAYPEAERVYREALDLTRDAQAPVWEAIILDGLGLALSCQGAYDQAEDCHIAALELNQAHGNAFQQVHNLTNLAALARHRGTVDLELPQKALDLAKSTGFKQYLPFCMIGLAHTHAALGAYAEAETMAQESYHLASSTGSIWTQVEALRLHGELAKKRGAIKEAWQWLGESVALAWANQDTSQVLRCLFEAARLSLMQEAPERAALWLYYLEPHPALPHWAGCAVREALQTLDEALPPATLKSLRRDSQNLRLETALMAAFPDLASTFSATPA